MDILLQILEAAVKYRPDSSFLKSLHLQYCERGGLSKKQLEGLHHKVSRIEDIPPSWLVTLEAIIKKKPTRYKSEVVNKAPETPAFEKEKAALEEMLEKFPTHKRLIFLKAKIQNHDILSPVEIAEIEKFRKLLLK